MTWRPLIQWLRRRPLTLADLDKHMTADGEIVYTTPRALREIDKDVIRKALAWVKPSPDDVKPA